MDDLNAWRNDWRNKGLAFAEDSELMEWAKNAEDPELLDYLVDITYHWWIHVEIIKNPHTSLDTLKKFLTEKETYSTFEKLDGNVAQALAESPKSTEEMLEEIFKLNPDWSAKAIAKHHNAPETILEEMSNWCYGKDEIEELKYEDWKIRLEIAKNPKTPKRIIEKLSKDIVLKVRQEAEKRLKILK